MTFPPGVPSGPATGTRSLLALAPTPRREGRR